MQDGVEVVALGVGELLTAHAAEDGQHIAAAVEREDAKLPVGALPVADEQTAIVIGCDVSRCQSFHIVKARHHDEVALNLFADQTAIL